MPVLGHVVGELLVAARDGFIQCGGDQFQAFHQRVVGLTERLHRRAKRIAQARHFHCAAGDLGGDGVELAGLRLDMVGEACADAFQQIGRGDYQGVHRGALLGGGVVHRI
jgi:hypothetical protein